MVFEDKLSVFSTESKATSLKTGTRLMVFEQYIVYNVDRASCPLSPEVQTSG